MKEEIVRMCKDPFNRENLIINDTFIVFNSKRYLKSFFYHFLFFFLLGPFATFPITWIENYNYAYNMGIWEWRNPGFKF